MLKKTGFLILIVLLQFGCLAPGYAAAKAKALPDLKITKIKAVKKIVKGQPKLLVTYTIKNIGAAPAPASVTKIVIKPLGIQSEQSCTPLDPNQEHSTSWYCPITKAGNYQIKAGANYNSAFPEMNQMNNQNSISFGFSRSL